jgi:hypothetical protein
MPGWRWRSWVSQVKPSPMVCHSTRSPKHSSARRSPVCQAPLMNCTTPTRQSFPSARSRRPNAAVDLPLPGPVWTISRPLEAMVLEATSASCTALRLAILAAWRRASGLASLMAAGVRRNWSSFPPCLPMEPPVSPGPCSARLRSKRPQAARNTPVVRMCSCMTTMTAVLLALASPPCRRLAQRHRSRPAHHLELREQQRLPDEPVPKSSSLRK